jgi:hypothetical protein
MRAVRELAGALKEMHRTSAPCSYAAAGTTIKCSHCGSELFKKRRIVVHGPLAHCLICARCSLAAWFEKPPLPRGESQQDGSKSGRRGPTRG